MPVIGFLNSASFEPNRNLVETFVQSLSQSGYVEGKNIAIEYRWANGQYDRLPALAAELVQRQVAVIAAAAPVAALAAQEAARALGQELVIVQASTVREIDDSVASVFQQTRRCTSRFRRRLPFKSGRSDRETGDALCAADMFCLPEAAAAGGLMSYGADRNDTWRQVGNYVGRILKGEKPGELPVQQPTKFDFVINMRTAKAFGLDVPVTLQLLADEVIE
jgi:ABC-type uncharacterized transport system substrate-binding protein